jgi:peroxiredoxin
MKKIYILILFSLSTVIVSAQTTKTLSDYKNDKTTIVKDSTGKTLEASAWFDLVKSNNYTLEQISAEGEEPREFKLRLSTADERRMSAQKMDRTGPITLAGFTTGKEIGDYSVVDVAGKTYTRDELKGKVVVLNFWFKDATPCKAEIPELNKLVKKYKAKNVVFLAPTYDPLEDVTEFLKKMPFNYIICTDVDQMIIDLKISKYPTHVVVDKQGVVHFVTIGQTDNIFLQLDYEINNLL